ncbi:MAG: YabP/YqfC family sporulation protein [Clostridia bacterium]|nr:YabP/YqfC family sporulation protein [Clostridia bacterium]
MKKQTKQNGEAADLRERLCRALDIVPDTLPRAGTVEIRGRNYVSIKEGGRILLYTPEKITVEIPNGAVSVLGKRLCCTSYTTGAVCIDGYVTTVCFEEV